MAKKKTLIIVVALAVLLLVTILGGRCLYNKALASGRKALIIESGYLPLLEAMELIKYKIVSNDATDYSFSKQDGGIDVVIDFYLNEERCVKGEYTFGLSGNILHADGIDYISGDKFAAITNVYVEYAEDGLVGYHSNYQGHDWTKVFAPLVAHSNGVYREADKNTIYNNSLDGMIQNYNLGHRVFENDFCMTTDGDLAVLHDWGSVVGEPMTAAQWKQQETIYGAKCRTMLIGDVLDQMIINKDMFMVTDTKTAQIGEQMKKEFQIIKDEAVKRDPELLNRIIPQIYNREMYTVVKDIYPFPSIIFTLYLTQETDDEIVSFVAENDDIKVVTIASDGSGRLHLAERLGEYDKLVYAHTPNAFGDIQALSQQGVDGFYTDFILPRDWKTYDEVVKGQATVQ